MKKSIDPRSQNSSRAKCHRVSRLATLALVAGGLSLTPVHAVSLYWDTDGSGIDAGYGGDGTWDAANLFWNTSPTIGSGSLQAWNSAASPLDDANFLRGTAGIIAVSGTQTLRSMSFGTSAGSFTTGSATYSVSGGVLDIRQASFGQAVSNQNGSVTTIDSTIHLFGAVASATENNRQIVRNVSGSLSLGNIHNIAGFSGAGNQTLALESFGTAISINGNITKAASAKGVVLDIGGSTTANAAIYTLAGNNTGLGGTATLNRGSLVLNHSSALVGASGLTVANVNTGASGDTAQVLTGTSGVTINKTVTFSTLGTDTNDVRVIGGIHTSGTSTFSGGITLSAFAASGSGSSLQVTSAAGGTTVFSGNISDGSNTVPITKVGDGVVIFSRAAGNSYDGGTTVTAGTLLINNTSGSGTGTGAVVVTAGTLGGNALVSGAVTIGNGAGGSDAFLSAGNSVGTFTTSNSLSLLSDATFVFELDSSAATADQVVANGVTIDGSSVFSVTDLAAGTLAINTEFIVISNTSGGAISGTFSNLANGSTFTQGANQFQVNYAGGVGGNDLVLTVVPEPSSALLAGLGLMVMLRLARRSRADF